MEKLKDFCDLDVWKRANEVTRVVYRFTLNFPKEERFGLSDQVRRSIASIPANIAEGFSRYHTNDKIRFYYNARGSISESKSHVLLARGLGYISDTESANLISELDIVGKQLNSMINSLRALYRSRSSKSPVPNP